MSRVDVHPEDVIDAIRRGDRRDERRIEDHVRHCRTCAVELDAMADFDAELAPRPGDDALLARIVSGAMDELHPARESIPAPGEGIRTARRAITVAAAAALVVGLFGGAAAAMWAMSVFESDDEPASREEPSRPPASPERSRREAPAPAPVDVAEPAVDEATAPAPEEVAPAPVGAGEPREIAAPSAADLLAQANRARNAGDNAEAARLYRALQRAHPSSRETAISRVAYGRLLLNRLHDPAGALAEFDRYLRGGSSGVLAEEARVGRAVALERLGRGADARAAWQDVLTHHPGSPNAERARARLE
jgi:TolA-binding protein